MQPYQRFGYNQAQPQPGTMPMLPNRGYAGYSNPSLGMMMSNTFGGIQPNVNLQQTTQEKEKQIQQLKGQFPNVQSKNVMNNNQPVDLVEMALNVQTSDVQLQVPMVLLIDARFPAEPPKIYIRAKLKHNLFDTRDQIIELDVNNVTQWVPQKTTLLEVMNKLKSIFDQDPPKQEKIIEDVNKLLSVVNEKNFRDIVESDPISSRNVNELKLLQGISFQELVCSSPEYKKIAQNLVDVVNFNEKIANELLQKRDEMEQHKQQLLLVSDQIEHKTREYNDRIVKCQGFKDAFSRQNLEAFIHKEIKNLDSQSLAFESLAQNTQGNIMDVLQQYYDTRKNFHRLNIVKLKLPELKYQ